MSAVRAMATPLRTVAAVLVTTACAAVGGAELELQSSAIRAVREGPRVLHILPWQPAALADLPGRPRASIVDDVLAPLERAVLARELDYRSQLEAARTTGAPTTEVISLILEE